MQLHIFNILGSDGSIKVLIPLSAEGADDSQAKYKVSKTDEPASLGNNALLGLNLISAAASMKKQKICLRLVGITTRTVGYILAHV